MKQCFTVLLFFFLISSCSNSDTNPESVKAEIEELLFDFLQGASVNDEQMHDRFWAKDLIYTSSAGERFGKEQIMAGYENEDEAEESPSDEPAVQYSYEDLQINLFDDAAVVAFRLVGTIDDGDKTGVMNYYNTGTFTNRNGEWRAVAWQATRIPE